MTMDTIIHELRQAEQRTRRLEAALRVARGYVAKEVSPQAGRDLANLDRALVTATGAA